jgi:hypothetical protein
MRRFVIALIVVAALPFRAAALSPSEEKLVADVRRDLDDPVVRPSHVDPALPGSFAELAEPHLLVMAASKKRIGADEWTTSDLLKAVFAGTKPLSDLPGVWAEESKKTQPDLDGLLLATRAGRGALPKPLTLYGLFSRDSQPYNFGSIQHAARLAAIVSLQALQRGDTAKARATCADVLALARDVSHSAIINQMVAAATLGIMTPACAHVIQKAAPQDRLELARQIRIIRTSWTPFSVTLHEEEALYVQLGLFQESLSPEVTAALPPEARLVVDPGEVTEWQRVRRSLFGGWAKRRLLVSLEEVVAAAEQPPRDADLALERITGPFAVFLAGDGSGPANWTGFARRYRTGQARLLLLQLSAEVWGARTKLGHWPTTWAEAALETPLDPRSGLEIKLEPAGPDGLRLVPQPDGERTTDDLSVLLRDQ